MNHWPVLFRLSVEKSSMLWFFYLYLKPVGNCFCRIGHAMAVNLFQTRVYFWLLVLAYSEGQCS